MCNVTIVHLYQHHYSFTMALLFICNSTAIHSQLWPSREVTMNEWLNPFFISYYFDLQLCSSFNGHCYCCGGCWLLCVELLLTTVNIRKDDDKVLAAVVWINVALIKATTTMTLLFKYNHHYSFTKAHTIIHLQWHCYSFVTALLFIHNGSNPWMINSLSYVMFIITDTGPFIP